MRPPRIDAAGAWHHVMNRGVDRRDIFVDDLDRLRFLRLLGESSTTSGMEVHAFCLMNNHYHLLLHSIRGGLSEMMKSLSERYTRSTNVRWERDGPVFRGRFHSVLVEDWDHQDRIVQYIHANPFDDGVIRPGFPWSSFDALEGRVRAPSWLQTGVVSTRLRPILAVPGLEEVIAAVASATGLPVEAVMAAARSRPEQRVALLLGRDRAGATSRELQQRFGYPTSNSVSVALRRARRALEADAALARLYDVAEARLVTLVSDPEVTGGHVGV